LNAYPKGSGNVQHEIFQPYCSDLFKIMPAAQLSLEAQQTAVNEATTARP